MENTPNVSSEEELLQLREQGKISEAEYEELRDAMQKTTNANDGTAPPEIDKTKLRRKIGIVAFVLMLMGIFLPVVCFLALEMLVAGPNTNTHAEIGPWIFLGVGLEISAALGGIAAWPDPFGKAAVIASLLVLILIAVFLFVIRRVSVADETPRPTPSKQIEATELKWFPVDNLEGIITQSGVRTLFGLPSF